MTLYNCPLYEQSKNVPDQLFIDGQEQWTYQEFEGYVQTLSQQLAEIQPGSVLATRADHITFTIALLIVALRKQLILFIVSHRLKNAEIQERLEEANVTHFFNEPLAIKTKLQPCFKKAPIYWPDIPLTYLLTSGTSSRPKICVHSALNHIESAQASNQRVPYKKGDRWLFNMPLNHVSGLSLIFRTLLAKATLILPSKNLEEDLKHQRISHFSCVNAQLKRALKYPEHLKTLKVILLGGGKALPSLIDEAQKHSLPLLKTYGLTEMSSQVATSKVPFEQPSLLPHVNLKIDHENQILIKGPSLFIGYLVNGKIQSHVNPEGYFETNDTGVLDNDRLTVLSRLDNLFICGGENVQPEEIEDILLKYPDITEAVVVPHKHPEYDVQPVAFIKVKDAFDATHLLDFLNQQLPRFKIPKKFLPLQYEDLKPSRKELRAQLIEKF